MREFIFYSRLGRTDPSWPNLHDAGRLDITHECIVAALFLSHGLRRNVVFHATLHGPPNPPLRIQIDGQALHDVRTDQQTWTDILKRILSYKPHPGITINKTSFEALVKANAAEKKPIYVLEERGTDISKVGIAENPVFILGDHVGLPQKAEDFALRYGQKISLAKQPYLAATCIVVLNYLLDKRENP
jgi:tRNA (pseudouridine54-N1)-methyltransferase